MTPPRFFAYSGAVKLYLYCHQLLRAIPLKRQNCLGGVTRKKHVLFCVQGVTENTLFCPGCVKNSQFRQGGHGKCPPPLQFF